MLGPRPLFLGCNGLPIENRTFFRACIYIAARGRSDLNRSRVRARRKIAPRRLAPARIDCEKPVPAGSTAAAATGPGKTARLRIVRRPAFLQARKSTAARGNARRNRRAGERSPPVSGDRSPSFRRRGIARMGSALARDRARGAEWRTDGVEQCEFAGLE